jgi:calcineurin-like phosphoesterase family protein
MKTYFTSDLHFHHSRICEFTDRKLFTSAEDHTEWLIEIWNKQVTKQDQVYHLGDFSFSHKQEEVNSVVKRLNGRKFFIKGNHDRSEIFDNLKKQNLIQNWFQYKEINVGDTPACLFHFPIASWHRQHYGSLMLHGHCHGSFQGQGKILDVGIDNAFNIFGEYRLFTQEDVLEFMHQRDVFTADHHKAD